MQHTTGHVAADTDSIADYVDGESIDADPVMTNSDLTAFMEYHSAHMKQYHRILDQDNAKHEAMVRRPNETPAD